MILCMLRTISSMNVLLLAGLERDEMSTTLSGDH